MPCPENCMELQRLYNQVELEVDAIELKISELKKERDYAAGMAGGGIVLLGAVAVVTGPIGWIGYAGIVLTLGGGAIGGSNHLTIKKLRDQCKDEVKQMFDYHQEALSAGCSKECRPPRTWVNRCR